VALNGDRVALLCGLVENASSLGMKLSSERNPFNAWKCVGRD